MSSLPPLDVSVRAKRFSCILDVELALSPYGLMFATRLAEEMEVWLVRTLWQILDNTQFYLSQPSHLLPATAAKATARADRRRHAAALASTLRQWEAARLETDLSGTGIFWAGDARCESLLPKDVEKSLVERFELMAADLDALSARSGSTLDVHDVVRDCARDTVALATALTRHRPIIFTLLGQGEGSTPGAGEPRLCKFLRECGISCQKVGNGLETSAIKRHLLTIFARAGVVELIWAGLDLAALHLVAPGALVMPAEGDSGQQFQERSVFVSATGPRRHAWNQGAAAFWWTIN